VRWDGDTRVRGVADAGAFADGAADLLDSMRTPEWVAEEPEAHLLPHLRTACEALPLDVAGTRVLDDGTFEVDLAWTGEPDRRGEVQQAVFALAGSIAESASYVRAHSPENGSLTFELVTGMLGEDLAFDTHGHTVRFVVRLL
jgi:hypothetical protein